MAYLGTPAATAEIIRKYGFSFQKKFGQNFLVDANILNKIVDSADIYKDDCVIEIGPGIGTLTQYLAESTGKVIAVEIDKNLIPILNETLSGYENVTIINGDILKTDINKLVCERNQGRPVKVIANLPYYITTPILFRLFESNADIAAITVMMQKEVADRFCAKPNTKDYNALSVITQYRCDVSYIMKVPRNVFSPKPNVDSAVLQFRFKESDPNIEDDELFALIKACFKQRRKTILNNLSEYLIDKEKARKILNSAGIDLQTRSEQLDLPAFIHLYEVMRK